MADNQDIAAARLFPGFEAQRFTFDGREYVMAPTVGHCQELLAEWTNHVEAKTEGDTDTGRAALAVLRLPRLLAMSCEDFPAEKVTEAPVSEQLGLAMCVAHTVDLLRIALDLSTPSTLN